MKPRMTKQRVEILNRLDSASLAWGYGDLGGKEYFFTDGGKAKQTVVEGMLNAGLLKFEETPLGPGQTIVRAQS